MSRPSLLTLVDNPVLLLHLTTRGLEMFEPHPHDEDAALRVAISASVSLAVMLAEFLWLIRDEVKYVWPRIRATWTARIYMLTRYVGLASQIFNVCFTVRMYLGVYTSPRGCRLWFSYQAIVVQFLLVFVEGLLMHRLYALFLRSRLILTMLICFALGQLGSMGVSARFAFTSNRYTVTCMLLRSNPGNAFFSATTMTTNVIIFFMTFWRYFRLPAKWTEGMGRVVMRDSAFSLGAITGEEFCLLVVGFVIRVTLISTGQ
ncbi:hypothetical protein OG21DRAFT_373642 [Imleria badia]|nr:hypothetical protein OG21DRAFT_373642 [Imleria badia]